MDLSDDPTTRGEQVASYFNLKNTSDIVLMYDSFVKYYEKDVGYWGDRTEKFVDEFIDFVRVDKGSRILDVAAGTGFAGKKLKDKGYFNIDALDGSKGMLEKAKEKGIYKNYIHTIVGPQPIEGIEKDSYDVLLSFGALKQNHLNTQCLEPLIYITKPGGYVYLLSSIEWLGDMRKEFEEKIRQLQDEGRVRWILMKESPDPYYESEHPLLYSFKVLK